MRTWFAADKTGFLCLAKTLSVREINSLHNPSIL